MLVIGQDEPTLTLEANRTLMHFPKNDMSPRFNPFTYTLEWPTGRLLNFSDSPVLSLLSFHYENEERISAVEMMKRAQNVSGLADETHMMRMEDRELSIPEEWQKFNLLFLRAMSWDPCCGFSFQGMFYLPGFSGRGFWRRSEYRYINPKILPNNVSSFGRQCRIVVVSPPNIGKTFFDDYFR